MKVFATSVALTALLAMPAVAQTSTNTPTTAAGNTNQLLTTMEAAGTTKAIVVNGKTFEAKTSDGAPAFVVVVPQSYVGTLTDNGGGIQSTLSKAGMKDVSPVNNSTLVKGVLDDQDNHKEGVLAVSGLNFSGSKSESDLNRNQFEKGLQSAGIKEESNFKGKLASAQTTGGKKVYMIIGDQNLTADGGNFNFNDSKVRSAFDKGGLSQLTMLDDTQVVQAQMGGDTIFVATGKDLTGK